MYQERSRTIPRALVKGPLALLGPAFVTAIAYVDPGNFATNLTAGSTYGYLLVWVVVVSNLMAMLIQYLSAKAGIATGQSLPALCRTHLRRPVTRGAGIRVRKALIWRYLRRFANRPAAAELDQGGPAAFTIGPGL